MKRVFSIMVLSSLFAIIYLSVTIPAAHASTGGPLDRLGDMLGFDGTGDNNGDNNGDNDQASNSDNIEHQT